MAKVVSKKAKKDWSAQIRCAQPVCGIGLHRVDGCFEIIEITFADIKSYTDEGDIIFYIKCPNCKQQLYPKWQLGPGQSQVVRNHIATKNKR